MKTHKDLDVWKKALSLVVEIYEITETLTLSHHKSLFDQLKKSSISIPSNIAEGASRKSKREFIRFLNIAMGSASELDTQLEIAGRLEIISADDLQKEVETIKKMIYGLIRNLQGKL